MTNAQEHCCRTCTYWEGDEGSNYGNCAYPIPEWLNLLVHRLDNLVLPTSSDFPTLMNRNDGEQCRTWEGA